jgi:aerobic carbon-monoxide dehydrogenase medium subunit
MHAFDYSRPSTLAEAEKALNTISGAKLLAGGQTLIPAMKLRLNHPACIIDLGGVAGLDAIGRKGDTLVIGAMATHAEIAESAEVSAAIAGLAHLAEGIGDPQVRNRGTIGGALANNDPAADYPAAVLALGATLKTNRRSIACGDFFKGLFTTALDDNEILAEIAFPIPKRFAYAKFANPASRFALVGVAVAETAAGVRVAVTGAGGNGVFRVAAMEAALAKSFAPESLSNTAVDPSDLASDIHADADYRAHLIGVMARRAVKAALA